MKKLLVLFCLGFLVVGCGGKEDSNNDQESTRETKVCTVEMAEMNMSVETEISGADDIMDKMTVAVTIPSTSGVEIDDAQKEQIKKSVMDQYGIEEGEGVDVDFEMDADKTKVVMTFDLEAITDDTKKAFNITTDEQKISDFVKSMEQAGATCK